MRTMEQLHEMQHEAEKLIDSIASARARIKEIEQEIITIGDDYCTGTAYWRDADDPNKAPKLYAMHGIDQPCPIHGTPEPGQRIRAYVGTKEENQREVLEAMERYARREHLQEKLQRFHTTLDQAWRVRRIAYDLQRLTTHV